MEAIEAVKDEIFGLIDSEPTDTGTGTDADATGDDADAASAADEDSSSSGRKLTSTTVRAASAVLRMFGI